MSNHNLTEAKRAKNDEFYTQLVDIEREVNAYLEYDKNVFKDKTVLLPCDDPERSNFTKYFAQNFIRFGLKKLISTSYAAKSHGKICMLTRDIIMDGKTDFQDIEWKYLEGDGDFRSKELQKLIEEADVVVTNPPFSLFREFLKWITKNDKKFLIIGNMNAITYKDLFPNIKNNKIWLGATGFNQGMYFQVSKNFQYAETYKFKKEENGIPVNRVPGIAWFTNIDHGRHHQPLQLMTETDNIKYSRHKEVCNIGYLKYDNYDAIEVPFTDAIPSDYKEVMGVPISFLDKYCPEQFEIVGCSDNGIINDLYKIPHFKKHNEPYIRNSKIYKRIFIKHINPA